MALRNVFEKMTPVMADYGHTDDKEGYIVPASDATNAYDLLKDVCEAIRQEPVRYDQNTYLCKGMPQPTCGTVGCRAGWIIQLVGEAGSINVPRILYRAMEILEGKPFGGAHYSDGDRDFRVGLLRLFDGDALKEEFPEEFDEDGHGPQLGTPEYVALGIRGIEQFMIRWEDRLRATPVEYKDEAQRSAELKAILDARAEAQKDQEELEWKIGIREEED